jgi:type II secretory ATPase GspE/PulE/Tfp pilus assembly ATPase PilB-like protein
MGAKPYLLAPALNDILAQRLVRRVCAGCAAVSPLPPELETRVQSILVSLKPETTKAYNVDLSNPVFKTSPGCPACQGLGYKGRIGIYEFFKMSPEIERIILSGAISEYQIRDIAVQAGMVTMVQDGILKAMQGITTVEEVFRVAQ